MAIESIFGERDHFAAQAPLQLVTTVLISRNPLMRAGIGSILAGTAFAVADDAPGDGSDMAEIAQGAPILCIIGESRSVPDLVETVVGLKARCPFARVVAVTDHLAPNALWRACQAGLDGLCLPTMSRDTLVKAFELVMLGETFIPAKLALEAASQASVRAESRAEPFAVVRSAQDSAAKTRRLSSREAEILHCLMEGAPNKTIARKLDVAEATVKIHVKAILRKIGAANRTQAAMWATAHLGTAANASSETMAD
jgi:two-component system, NarL family, nitrate/nitrite response regulator NarL